MKSPTSHVSRQLKKATQYGLHISLGHFLLDEWEVCLYAKIPYRLHIRKEKRRRELLHKYERTSHSFNKNGMDSGSIYHIKLRKK
jgi:hypothetical protein